MGKEPATGTGKGNDDRRAHAGLPLEQTWTQRMQSEQGTSSTAISGVPAWRMEGQPLAHTINRSISSAVWVGSN